MTEGAQKQTQKQSVFDKYITDVIVTISCVLGFALCLFLFWNDLNMTLTRLGETQIGTISFRYNTAQRRFIDRVLWDRLRNDSPVYNGDVIRTADLSEAVIRFADGNTIELYPNTLIQIFLDKIEFSLGGLVVNVSSDSGMLIASGSNTLTAGLGSVFQLGSDEEGAFDLTVNEGNAFLGNNQITAGDIMSLSASGQIQQRPRAAAVFPAPGASLLTQESSPLGIEFVWNKINYPPQIQTRLEISADRNFSRVSYSVNTEENRQLVNLPQGTWFWRVIALSGEAQRETQYSRLTVINSPVPTLKSPANNQEFNYRSRSPSIRFQWTSSEGASHYILEAANNDSFNNPQIRQQVRSNEGRDISVSSSVLGEGIWYWRVTPVYGREVSVSQNVSSSQTGTFTLRRGAALQAPVLTAPDNDTYINIEEGRRDILFSWRRENEAASYTIRISADRNMNSPIIEHVTTDSFYRYGAAETAITPGVWYWTVSYRAADGAQSPSAVPRTFTALRGEIIQRTIFPPDNYIIAENLLPDMRFTWKTNLNNTRFQVSRTENFAVLVLNEPAFAEAYTVSSLRSGEYYWRITGTSGTQQFQSQPRGLSVAEALPPPALSPPESGISSGLSGRVIIQYGEPVNFAWDSLTEADYYSFKLYRGDGSGAPIYETLVYDSNISVNLDDYEDGTFTWTVQAMARDSITHSRRTGLAASQSAIFRHIQPVVIEYPVSGFEYAGIDASRRPGTARWSSLEVPHNVQFIIARDQRMTDIVAEINDVERSFTLPRLASGDYYWMIKAQTVEGFDISTRSLSHIKVLPIAPLPAPQNRSPADGLTIGAAQIRASRSINFSWNRVNGANGYIVTITQGSGRSQRTVFESDVITQTRFSLEDLRSLGRGDFSWSVEAVFTYEGLIEQRGIIQQNRLIIDIPVPPQIQTRDSGVLYGQ
ncbi:MAG: hypothetical protein FWD28_06010 [Treponema sp.]|nr:hypothetical protein [Treponema sp.]